MSCRVLIRALTKREKQRETDCVQVTAGSPAFLAPELCAGTPPPRCQVVPGYCRVDDAPQPERFREASGWMCGRWVSRCTASCSGRCRTWPTMCSTCTRRSAPNRTSALSLFLLGKVSLLAYLPVSGYCVCWFSSATAPSRPSG